MKNPFPRCDVTFATTITEAMPKAAIRVNSPTIKPKEPRNSAKMAKMAKTAKTAGIPIFPVKKSRVLENR